MFDNIRGVINFKILCAEPEVLINKLKISYVSCKNLRILHNEIYGEVYTDDFATLKEIADKCNGQTEIIKKKGVIFKAVKYKKRFGVILGLIVGLALVIFLSNVVMVIEISGNENVTDEQIIAILDDNGIAIGSFIPNIDFRQAERRIIVGIDNLAWIGIRNTGCRVIVEVNEMTPVPEMVPTSRPCNVVSTKDAQIVSVNVYMGRLLPLVGDGVRKGELLVSGVVKGKFDNCYYVHAMGDIIGRYNQKVIFEQKLEDNIVCYDEPFTKKTFSFFGLKIPLYLNKDVEGDYEYTEEMNNVQLLKLTLPVGIIYSEYQPYTIEKTTYTEKEAEDILNEKIKRYEQNFLNNDDIKVIDKKVRKSLVDGCMTVSVEYTLEGNIATTEEIMVKK